MKRSVGEMKQTVGETKQFVGEMKQIWWGDEATWWGNEAKCVGEMPHRQSEITPSHKWKLLTLAIAWLEKWVRSDVLLPLFVQQTCYRWATHWAVRRLQGNCIAIVSVQCLQCNRCSAPGPYLTFVTSTTSGACGEKICHVEKFFHVTDCNVENFLHMRNVKKICHIEKALHMINLEQNVLCGEMWRNLSCGLHSVEKCFHKTDFSTWTK